MSTGLIISTIIGYFIVLIVIAWATSKNADNDSFFTGNHQSPWYVVAFGMIGASLSGVTFLSVPGAVGGGQFFYMQVVFGYFVGYLIIAYVLLPLYYKMKLTSIYEYLQHRFGFYTYKTGAFFFLISRVIGASIRLLLVAKVLQEILFNQYGIPFWVTVIVSVLLIWIYTNRGGIKTIIWTDTLQTAFMLIAVILAVILIANQLNLGEQGGIVKAVSNSGYSSMFAFNSFLEGNYFWKSFIGGIFITVGMTGLDQDMMQKNLTCKNTKEAQKNMISMAAVLVVVNLIFLSLGALLFMYANQTQIGMEAINSNRTDLLFANIAMSKSLGTTVGLLFLLGLIAAAYSSADSALTSLTTSFSIDFLNIKKKSQHQQLSIRKNVHVIMSGVIILTVIILEKTTSTSAIWLLIKLAGFTYGPLIALFFFGIFNQRKLNDKLVPFVAIVVPAILGTIWYLHSNDHISWFGEYKFGAELIVYNAVISYLSLFMISKVETESKVLDA